MTTQPALHSTAEPQSKTPLTAALLTSTLIAALGGLLFGFDTAVISGTTSDLDRVFELGALSVNLPWIGAYRLEGFWLGFTVASALAGTVLGALIAGRPADWLGRRPVLVIIAVLYFTSALGSAFPWNWSSFVFFRFLGGIGVGGASVVAPMYIAEIAPAHLRGRLVAVTQFNIVLGILLAYLSNYVVSQIAPGNDAWRWMFGVEAAPAAVFFVLLFATPESPRWLVSRRRSEEARGVLLSLGNSAATTDQQLAEIEESLSLASHYAGESLWRSAYRQPVLLAIAIAAFNQLSGINALMYYAPDIFAKAGAGKDAALLSAVAVGLTNLVFTMAALVIIDHVGRRTLMWVGSLGYIASLGATAAAFYSYGEAFTPAGTAVVLGSLLVFIAAHAFGQGAVIWVFISEIFPNRVRAQGQALGSFTHWIMAAVISLTFPLFAKESGGHTFAFYGAMMVLQLLWVWRIMPETKGVPLEQIQKQLGIK